MARFTLPRDLYYGPGSLSQLRELHGSKAVLVLGGGSMKRYGFVDRALSYLKEAGIDTTLIEGVEQDPSVETVLRGAQRMRELCPDLILSMGGGCRLTVGGKTKFACVDGPDFDGFEVDFDEAMARSSIYKPFERHAYEEACHLFEKEVR